MTSPTSFSCIYAAVLIVAISFAIPCGGQSTVRIRFVDGKTGKPLKLKYYSVTAGGEKYYDYTVEKIERDALVVTFPHSSTFSFGNDAYYRCDTKKESTPPITYDIEQIVVHGVVSPNICGPYHQAPTKGELLIYSRREHWWKFAARLPKGLICG